MQLADKTSWGWHQADVVCQFPTRHPWLSAWLHKREVEVCASCGTRTVRSFSQEYKMEKKVVEIL